jgi:iron complex outermembrane receptor protein
MSASHSQLLRPLLKFPALLESPVHKSTAFVSLLLAVSVSHAAPASAPDPLMEEIVVIGTRSSPRTALDTPVPVDVLSARDLESTGAVAGELGQALVAVAPSFFFPRQSNSGTSDLVRAGQLRGLSPDQMLVLVNGKRRHTSAVVHTETKIGRGTAAVDFNTIPLNAIRRIEVLRDGAGAQYGSDAIAGVVNIVLDDTLGFEANLGLGQHFTDLEPIDDDLTDGGTITLDAKYGFAFAGEGIMKVGMEYRERDSTNRAGLDTIPFFVPQTPDNLALAGQRLYAEGDPDVEELSLWWNTSYPAGEVEFFTFGTFSDRESSGGGAFFRYPDSAENVRAVFDQGYRPETRGDDSDFSASAGARFQAGSWDMESSITYGRNEFEFGVANSLNASLGAASPTSFDSGGYELRQLSANVDAVREFDTALASAPLVLAIGAEYRDESFETKPGDPASFAAGAFDGPPGAQAAPGLTPDDAADEDRDVISIYADAGIELTDDLFVNAAARFEDYSDFGSSFTGKLALRFALNDHLALRAAVSNSFRAPNLAQVGFSDTTLNFGDNRTLIRTRTLTVDDPIAQSLGASSLDEEQSFNLSAGIVAQWENFTLTLDAFSIDVDDRITLSERLFGDDLVAFVQAQPGGADVESVRFFTNAVDTSTEGIEAVLTWQTALAGGKLDVTASYSYAKTKIDDLRATTSELTAIDPSLLLVGVEEINTLEDAAPKHKGLLSARWSNNRFDALVRLAHYGSAKRVFNFGGGFEPEQTYGEELQLDVEAGYQITDKLSVVVGAANLLDEYPDLSSNDINFFGNLPYDILSPVGVNGRYVYSRIRFSM